MQLVTNINGRTLNYFTGQVEYVSSVIGEIKQSDYIDLQGYTGLIQNLSKTEFTQSLVTPLQFGLANPHNIPMITLQMEY